MSYSRVIPPQKRMNLSSAEQHPTTAPTRRLSTVDPGRDEKKKKNDPTESLENAI